MKTKTKQIKRDPTQLDLVDLQLPIENLKEPFKPKAYNPWVMSIENKANPNPSSLTGLYAYLSVTHEGALHDNQ